MNRPNDITIKDDFCVHGEVLLQMRGGLILVKTHRTPALNPQKVHELIAALKERAKWMDEQRG